MQPRILFVDDEELIVTMAAGYLARNGFSVTTAGSVREALSQYEPDDFDLIVTDLMMEPEDGTVLYHQIKTINPGAKILFMSGLGEHEMVKKYIKSGEARFLSKPFGIRELKDAVEAALS